MINLDENYSSFEQAAVLAWTSAMFTEWLLKNPNANANEKEQAFAKFVEGGLYVVSGTLRDFLGD